MRHVTIGHRRSGGSPAYSARTSGPRATSACMTGIAAGEGDEPEVHCEFTDGQVGEVDCYAFNDRLNDAGYCCRR